MSLRLRLLAGLFLIVAVGVVAVDVVTYVSLRSFLFDRVDEQLLSARLPANLGLNESANGTTPDTSGRKGPLSYVPPGTYAELRDAQGHVTRTLSFVLGGQTPQPKLPATLIAPKTPDSPGQYFTADAKGGGNYRVLVSPTRGDNSLVVAIPLGEVQSTLNRVIIIELFVSLAAIAAVCLIGWWLLRLGLRPLDHVARTADAIAEGDLSRRIEHPDRRTEVGRLGVAFNTMIDRIEQAFAQRAGTERRLRQFVADASHELRTPLTSIRGYAELFSHDSRERAPEDIEGAMHRIEAETRRMAVMVENLLLLARLDQEAPLKLAHMDLSAVIAECAADAQVVDPAREWTLSTTPGIVVIGDEDRLRQVASNLLANVRHHTPPGTKASVRLTQQGSSAIFEVADTGPGIGEEELRHVFERFYRVDRARTRRRGGSGLGLSIVEAIVAAHGGSVEASSEPGHGARFTVTLPAVTAAANGYQQQPTKAISSL